MSQIETQVEGLKKELIRVRTKARILEKLIELKCDIRDCAFLAPLESGWKSPQGFPMAVSFEVLGGNNALVEVGAANFVVYGPDIESIREAALYYGSQKYGASRLYKEKVEHQSQIGRMIEVKKIKGRGYYCLSPEQQAIVDAGGTVEFEGEQIQAILSPVEIVGIYPTWFHGDETPCKETMYISNEGHRLTLSELRKIPEWNWEQDFYCDAD